MVFPRARYDTTSWERHGFFIVWQLSFIRPKSTLAVRTFWNRYGNGHTIASSSSSSSTDRATHMQMVRERQQRIMDEKAREAAEERAKRKDDQKKETKPPKKKVERKLPPDSSGYNPMQPWSTGSSRYTYVLCVVAHDHGAHHFCFLYLQARSAHGPPWMRSVVRKGSSWPFGTPLQNRTNKSWFTHVNPQPDGRSAFTI